MNQEISNTSNLPPWSDLPPGFHTLRIGTAEADFTAFVWKGGDKPVAVVNGATHGDEYEGPTFLSNLAAKGQDRTINGTVVAIPVLNEPAFFAGTRCHPVDGGNLARVFPGNPKGSPTEQLADLFLTQVMRHADYYLDFHSGGVTYGLLPWVGYLRSTDEEMEKTQARMSACFDRYWCWASPYVGGRTISAAFENNIPSIYTESRGGGSVHPDDLAMLEEGFERFLKAFDFLPDPCPDLKNRAVHYSDSSEDAHLQTHHPSPLQGIFIPEVVLGDWIEKGENIGTVRALTGDASASVKASHSGTLVSLSRKRSVLKNDALATIVPIKL